MPALDQTDHHPYQGMSWTHDLDFAQLLATLGVTQSGEAGDEQAAAEESAAEGGAARELTGAIADQLPPGPGLAAWVGGTDPAAVGEWDLPGVASAFRRLAAWAQAGSSPPSPRWRPGRLAGTTMCTWTLTGARIRSPRPPGRRWAWSW